MAYNLTGLNNVTSPGQVLIALNEATNGAPAIAFLTLVFVVSSVIMIVSWKDSVVKGLVGSSFATTVVAFIMWVVGFITLEIVFIPLSLLLLMFLLGGFVK